MKIFDDGQILIDYFFVFGEKTKELPVIITDMEIP